MLRTKAKRIKRSNILKLDKKRKLTNFEMILNEERLLHELEKVVYCPTFDDESLHEEIMQPMPDLDKFIEEQKKGKENLNKYIPPELVSMYGEVVMKRKQEFHQFRKYNFLKFQARKIVTSGPDVSIVDQIRATRLLRDALIVKDFIIRSNMRLALDGAKKFSYGTNQVGRMWDLFGEAYYCILKSVLCFDFTTGFKFGTYSTWGIKANLGRETSEFRKHNKRYVNGLENENLEKLTIFEESTKYADNMEAYGKLLKRLFKYLDSRQLHIIKRYMLDDDKPTLDQLGTELNITKERIRQINKQSMKRMKEAIVKEGISLEKLEMIIC